MSAPDFNLTADITVASKDGVVGLGFKTGEKPRRWVHMSASDARALAEGILKNLDEGAAGERGGQ